MNETRVQIVTEYRNNKENKTLSHFACALIDSLCGETDICVIKKEECFHLVRFNGENDRKRWMNKRARSHQWAREKIGIIVEFFSVPFLLAAFFIHFFFTVFILLLLWAPPPLYARAHCIWFLFYPIHIVYSETQRFTFRAKKNYFTRLRRICARHIDRKNLEFRWMGKRERNREYKSQNQKGRRHCHTECEQSNQRQREKWREMFFASVKRVKRRPISQIEFTIQIYVVCVPMWIGVKKSHPPKSFPSHIIFHLVSLFSAIAILPISFCYFRNMFFPGSAYSLYRSIKFFRGVVFYVLFLSIVK